jgi:hypothetical protein
MADSDIIVSLHLIIPFISMLAIHEKYSVLRSESQIYDVRGIIYNILFSSELIIYEWATLGDAIQIEIPI